ESLVAHAAAVPGRGRRYGRAVPGWRAGPDDRVSDCLRSRLRPKRARLLAGAPAPDRGRVAPEAQADCAGLAGPLHPDARRLGRLWGGRPLETAPPRLCIPAPLDGAVWGVSASCARSPRNVNAPGNDPEAVWRRPTTISGRVRVTQPRRPG